MCKISIITPVYKVEKYLRKCIDSILNQTFTDYELFIVDDGSPDSCGQIADEYKKKDKRVHVIHKKNGGAPSARNAGISVANGKYLYFPDSDDWIEPTYLQDMYDLAVRTGAQLTISGYTMEYYENDSNQSYIVSALESCYSTQAAVRGSLHKYFDNMMMAVPWNKLYKADYIKDKGIQFPDLKWDDLHFNMEVVKDIESVAISSSFGYHFFRSRAGSETTFVFDGMLYQKRKEQFQHILRVYKHWEIKNKDIISAIYGYYAGRIVQCVQEIAVSDAPHKRNLVNEILQDDLTKKAFKYGKINSRLLAIVAIPMKVKSVNGSIAIGKTIGFAKKNMPVVFYRLKSTSVNNAKVK